MERKNSGDLNNQDLKSFVSEEVVQAAEAALRATSAQLAVTERADKVMPERERTFKDTIHDPGVEELCALVNSPDITPSSYENLKSLHSSVSKKLPGEYFSLGNQIFFMTGDNKVQEAKAYVNRLEKSLINLMGEKLAADLTISNLKKDLSAKKSFWQRLKTFFSKEPIL